MSVNSVGNKNSNIGLYTGAAVVAGGGAGALVGWNTKPFLNGDGPSDTFIKNVMAKGENLDLPDNPILTEVKKLSEQANSAKSIEELKELSLKPIRDMYSTIDNIEDIRGALNYTAEILKAAGESFSAEDIASVKSVDDAVNLFGRKFDEQFAGKTLEEIRKSSTEEFQKFAKESIKNAFNEMWDSKDKKFIEIDNLCELDNDVMDIVKATRKVFVDAANGMKGKAALLYGAGAAVVAGLGTFAGLKLAHKPAKDLPEQNDEQKINQEV